MIASPRAPAPDEPAAPPPALHVAPVARGALLTLPATVIRFQGPYVQVQILGELLTVLTSTLEKELGNGR